MSGDERRRSQQYNQEGETENEENVPSLLVLFSTTTAQTSNQDTQGPPSKTSTGGIMVFPAGIRVHGDRDGEFDFYGRRLGGRFSKSRTTPCTRRRVHLAILYPWLGKSHRRDPEDTGGFSCFPGGAVSQRQK